MTPNEELHTNQQATAQFLYGMILSLVFLAVLALVFYVRASIEGGAWQFKATVVLLMASMGTKLLAAWAVRVRRFYQAAWIMMADVSVTLVLMSLLVSGLWLGRAWLAFVVVAVVAVRVLPPREMNQAIMLGILNGLLIVLLEVWNPGERPFWADSQLLWVWGGIFLLLLVYSGTVLWHIFRYTLQTKIILVSLLLTLLPTVVLGGVARHHLYTALTNHAQTTLTGAANRLADQFDGFIAANLEHLVLTTRLPGFAAYLILPPAERAGSQPEQLVLAVLRVLPGYDTPQTVSYALYDQTGQLSLTSGAANQESDATGLAYFQEPFSSKRPFVSFIQTSETSTDPAFIYFSAPVLNEQEQVVGVLVVRHQTAVLQQLLVNHQNQVGEDVFAMLVDENLMYLAHGATPTAVSTVVTPLSVNQPSVFRTSGFVPVGLFFQFSTQTVDFYDVLLPDTPLPFFSTTLEIAGKQGMYFAATSPMSSRPWQVVYVQPERAFLSTIQSQTNTTIGLALLLAGGVLLMAFFLSQLLTRPLLQLTAVVNRVAAGDLNTSITVSTQDEMGLLALAFTRMTAQLRSLVYNLEQDVLARKQAERQQQILYETLRAVSEMQDYSQVAEAAVQTIGRFTSWGHIGLNILDDSGDYVIHLAGSHGEPLDPAYHQFPVTKGVVGRAIRTEQTQLVPDVSLDPDYEARISSSKSVLSVPMKYGGRIFGVLHIEDSQLNAFTTGDVALVESLAEALALALNNAWLRTQLEDRVTIRTAELQQANFQLVQSISELKAAESKLRSSEQRLKLAMDASHIGIWDWNIVTGTVIWSDNVAGILGVSPESFAGTYQAYLDIVYPADREMILQAIQNALLRTETYYVEHRTVHSNTHWLQCIGQVIFDEKTGLPQRMMGTVWDVSKTKQHEATMQASLQEKEVLLKEIHHRVKNNLQVISSLLDLQSYYIQDPAALQTFVESQRRVRAMALIHEKLYQSHDLARINFVEYAESLTNYLWQSFGSMASQVEIQFNIANLSLSVETAVPCGLIINELISNALKHAFPNGRQGQITVGLQQQTHQTLVLSVVDNGVGFPEEVVDFRYTKSLGLTIVMTLVRQLNGAMELIKTDVTTFQVLFPYVDK